MKLGVSGTEKWAEAIGGVLRLGSSDAGPHYANGKGAGRPSGDAAPRDHAKHKSWNRVLRKSRNAQLVR